MQAPPAQRSGQFDWAACNNSDLAELVATQLVSGGFPYTAIAYQLSCVSKELSGAVSNAMGKEMCNLQSLWEDYRKLVLMKESSLFNRSHKGYTSHHELFAEFRDTFAHFLGRTHAFSYLNQITLLFEQQKDCADRPDSHKYVMTKFGLNFQDYALMAHMCCGVCMISNSKASGPMQLKFPFGQQVRVACVHSEKYKLQTVKYSAKMNDLDIVRAIRRQYNYEMSNTEFLSVARKVLASPIGFYKSNRSETEWVELPLLPSKFVSKEQSFVGRLNLDSVQIQGALAEVQRCEKAVADEQNAVEIIRVSRFSADASAWLTRIGVPLNVEQVCELLGEDVAGCWTRTAALLVHGEKIVKAHPLDNPISLRLLELMRHQLKMRALFSELTGQNLTGKELAKVTLEMAPPIRTLTCKDHRYMSLLNVWHEVPTFGHKGSITWCQSPMAIAVEHVANKLRNGQASFSVERSKDNLYWSVDLGSGFMLKQKMFVMDATGRVVLERFSAINIRDVFKSCCDHRGAATVCPSIPKIDRARSILCGMEKIGPREKDHASTLLLAIKSLIMEMRGTPDGNTIGLRLFKIGKEHIREALMNLHERWWCRQIPDLPAQCPLTTRDFALELVGNPLRLPISYLHRPPPKPSTEAIARREEHEAQVQAILAQIPEPHASDSDDESAEESDAECLGFVAHSPQYSPGSN